MDGTQVPCRGHVVPSDGPIARGFRTDIEPCEGIVPWVRGTNDKGPAIVRRWTQVVCDLCPCRCGISIYTRPPRAHESSEESGSD